MTNQDDTDAAWDQQEQDERQRIKEDFVERVNQALSVRKEYYSCQTCGQDSRLADYWDGMEQELEQKADRIEALEMALQDIQLFAHNNIRNTSVLTSNPPQNEVAFHVKSMAKKALKP